jgi:hypothetical protein
VTLDTDGAKLNAAGAIARTVPDTTLNSVATDDMISSTSNRWRDRAERFVACKPMTVARTRDRFGGQARVTSGAAGCECEYEERKRLS